MAKRLTLYILIGMALGVIVGYAVRLSVPQPSEAFDYWLKSFGLLSSIFLNLIKMLVAPLILSTIVVGIAQMGDSSALGRIGFRAIARWVSNSPAAIAGESNDLSRWGNVGARASTSSA